MGKSFDVVALGELLIDFTDNGPSAQGNRLFEANPGGAPCNVLAMLSRLGRRTAFIGKVGDDLFGRQLKETIGALGIDTADLYMDERVKTTLAFVQTLPGGDRDFSFYRDPGADIMLTADEVREERLTDTRIFHFGTLSLTHAGVRAATQKAVRIAKAGGALISFDPNLRPPLWASLEEAHAQTAYGLAQCDVLKIADNEILWFTGERDYDAAVAALRREYPIPLVLLTLGREGSRAYFGDLRVDVPAFLQAGTIETTGAGDTFCACCLHHILRTGLDALDEAGLTEMLTFANAGASIITTRRGALKVMPTPEEIAALCAAGKDTQ
ncbi:MAG: carbohydrate kinase [Clostridia bacterium]|nr:carbohydrate kinase [Clostridia bacterium]